MVKTRAGTALELKLNERYEKLESSFIKFKGDDPNSSVLEPVMLSWQEQIHETLKDLLNYVEKNEKRFEKIDQEADNDKEQLSSSIEDLKLKINHNEREQENRCQKRDNEMRD